MQRILRNTRYVKVGDVIEALYPLHGKRNILRTVVGRVVKVGRGPSGRYVTVQGEGGLCRSLSDSKIVRIRRVR